MKSIIPYLLLITMIFLIMVSWKNTFVFRNSDEKNYEKYIASAEVYESKKIYIDAVENYKNALSIKPDNYDLAMKIVDIYDILDIEDSYISACKAAIKADNTQIEPYILLADLYKDKKQFSQEYSILKDAAENIDDNEITSRINEVKGIYELNSMKYDDIKDYCFHTDSEKGYAVVESEGKFGLIDNNNDVIADCIYDDIGLLSENLIPVKSDNEYYYINSDGYRKLVPDEKADYLGTFSSGYAPIEVNGKYGYVDDKMNITEITYDFAGCFSDEIAAVEKDGKWAIIDTSLKTITDWEFDDILLDCYGHCSSQNIFWAKKNGKFYMYDNKGNQISDIGYDNAHMFVSDEPTAVESDGKWGFVSIKGEKVTDFVYEDAKPFNYGYAPVNIEEKWGCIDINGTVLIEPQFSDMTSFYPDGFSIINSDGVKQILSIKIYD